MMKSHSLIIKSVGEEYQDSKDVQLDDNTLQKTGIVLKVELILCKVQWVVYNMSCNSALVVTLFYWIYFNTGNQFFYYTAYLSVVSFKEIQHFLVLHLIKYIIKICFICIKSFELVMLNIIIVDTVVMELALQV